MTDEQIEFAIAKFFERGPQERETIVRQSDDEKVWHIGTDSPSRIRKLLNRGYRPDKQMSNDGQMVFVVPNNKVSFRDPSKTAKRVLTDEEKQAITERFKKAREAKVAFSL